MDIDTAKKIMGENFIGPRELGSIAARMHIQPPAGAPEIPYGEELLLRMRNDYILILGVAQDADGSPLTIVRLRDIFGTDPAKAEPCMYNQDWYLNEKFARETTLGNQWYLIKKQVEDGSRASTPEEIEASFEDREQFPSAILTVFTFLAYYMLQKGACLWEHDFVWCSDTDSNGDRIYTGRYRDPQGISKNGFNIHRHLSIRPCYGVAPMIIPQ